MNSGNGNGNTSLATRGMTTEIVGPDGEVLDFRDAPSALEAVTRAEIDIQISTAKRFPRSYERFLREAKSMVSSDPDLAAQCLYVLPARRGGDNKPISGPSVRLAEIVASCWGNLRIIGRIVDDDGKTLTGQGVAIDLERNVGYSVEGRRGVQTRDGRRFSSDMVNVTANALIAIVTRNATLKVVPKAFVNLIQNEAQRVARGDVKTLPERAKAAVAHFTALGVAEPEIYKALGVVGKADITLDHLMVLGGYKVSIDEGHSTVAEIFRPSPTQAEVQAPPMPGAPRSQTIAEKLMSNDPKPSAPDPGGPVTHILDGVPVTDEDLIGQARGLGYAGEDDGSFTAQGAAYILKEAGHKVSKK